MKKKETIRDFASLKGKITFPEEMPISAKPAGNPGSSGRESRPVPAEMTSGESAVKPGGESASKPSGKPAESGGKMPKPGQEVVMLDYALRGRIASVKGQKFIIELEDGLEIEASDGEFAVTDGAELSALKKAAASKDKSVSKAKDAHISESAAAGTIRHVQSKNVKELTVDLHIESIPGWRSVPKGQQLQFQVSYFKRIINENLPHKGMRISFIHGIGDGILKAAVRKELAQVYALKCTFTVGDPAVTVVTIK